MRRSNMADEELMARRNDPDGSRLAYIGITDHKIDQLSTGGFAYCVYFTMCRNHRAGFQSVEWGS